MPQRIYAKLVQTVVNGTFGMKVFEIVILCVIMTCKDWNTINYCINNVERCWFVVLKCFPNHN